MNWLNIQRVKKNQRAVHIQKNLSDGSVGEIPTEELLKIGDVIKNGTVHKNHGKNVYYFKKDGIKYRLIAWSGKNDNEKVIKFNSNKNLEEKKGYEISVITNNSSSDKNIVPQTEKDINIRDGKAGLDNDSQNYNNNQPVSRETTKNSENSLVTDLESTHHRGGGASRSFATDDTTSEPTNPDSSSTIVDKEIIP